MGVLGVKDNLPLKLNRRRLDSVLITEIDVESRFDIDDFSSSGLIILFRFISFKKLASLPNLFISNINKIIDRIV